MLSIEELEATFRSARAELEAYGEQVAAKYRQLIPDPPQWTGPGTDPEAARARSAAVSDAERARTARLRQAAMEASLLLARARVAAKLEGHRGV
ncbi:hypothetical protein DN069_04680 [Streptacidiphilus pinicola]|uniref:Uncharacterized protein n=1 Tax=Streptacidiphilus pinicola TaxID=2219663 RepID=A0A2X0IU03_9ACTN|nr:hypothetical protein [Streptacidiphilus pinicola]RAG86831.1 hypothetical protein DN069_04680 [Streptacidiphilus pinicola]